MTLGIRDEDTEGEVGRNVGAVSVDQGFAAFCARTPPLPSEVNTV
jgi:hypothetical protein